MILEYFQIFFQALGITGLILMVLFSIFLARTINWRDFKRSLTYSVKDHPAVLKIFQDGGMFFITGVLGYFSCMP